MRRDAADLSRCGCRQKWVDGIKPPEVVGRQCRTQYRLRIRTAPIGGVQSVSGLALASLGSGKIAVDQHIRHCARTPRTISSRAQVATPKVDGLANFTEPEAAGWLHQSGCCTICTPPEVHDRRRAGGFSKETRVLTACDRRRLEMDLRRRTDRYSIQIGAAIQHGFQVRKIREAIDFGVATSHATRWYAAFLRQMPECVDRPRSCRSPTMMRCLIPLH